MDIMVDRINFLCEIILETQSVDTAIDIGELLAAKKSELRHGEFTPWIKKNLPFTDRTARRYITLFRNKERLEHTGTIAKGYRILRSLKTDTVQKNLTSEIKTKTDTSKKETFKTDTEDIPVFDLKFIKDIPRDHDVTLKPNRFVDFKKETWNIEELESFFADIEIPAAPIELRPGETIIDPHKFIKSHLDTIIAQNGKPVYRSYRDNLIEFKTVLENLKS